jgi:adenylate cyclase
MSRRQGRPVTIAQGIAEHSHMAESAGAKNLDRLFDEVEWAGLKLAIKGRLVALFLVGGLMIATRDADRAFEFIAAIALFTVLGLIHYQIIGGRFDRAWTKYLFLTIDILALSAVVALAPATTEVDLPKTFTYRFDVFPFYFIILGIAAFSFSPGLLVWAYIWISNQMPGILQWTDVPANATREQYMAIVLNENFAPAGSRAQEATIYLVVAILIAIVMYRARRTVRRQLEAEQDKATVAQLFGRFVPQSIADAMIKDRGLLDPVESEATAMFVDIAGFTNLTENKGPGATVGILNAYFDEATAIIGAHGGVVTQFQGDAVLAIFNVPTPDPDHVRHAFNAARALLDLVRDRHFGGERLGIRIGLATGPVVAGNVGGGGRQSYTVYGDTVNLAARLEVLNKEHGTPILIAGTTADRLNGAALRPIGETRIRGLSDPVPLYTLADAG